MPLYKLRIEARDLAAGRTAASILESEAAPQALAVTLFELKPPAFVVEAYYDEAPSLDAIARLLAGHGAGLGKPSLETVPDANWVALSQAALPPIRAGTFVVHGSHDRARFAMRRVAIEIEAGEAFGTGHNATTALCLEALDSACAPPALRKRARSRVRQRSARHCGGARAAGRARARQRQRSGRDGDCARQRTAQSRGSARTHHHGRRLRASRIAPRAAFRSGAGQCSATTSHRAGADDAACSRSWRHCNIVGAAGSPGARGGCRVSLARIPPAALHAKCRMGGALPAQHTVVIFTGLGARLYEAVD